MEMVMLTDAQEWQAKKKINLVHMVLTFVSGDLITSAQLREMDFIEGRATKQHSVTAFLHTLHGMTDPICLRLTSRSSCTSLAYLRTKSLMWTAPGKNTASSSSCTSYLLMTMRWVYRNKGKWGLHQQPWKPLLFPQHRCSPKCPRITFQNPLK